MKRVNLVGDYSYREAKPCEFEDLDLFRKMAYIDKPNTHVLYSPLKAKAVRIGWPLFASSRSIHRWKIVQDQHGKMVLFYREHRMPMHVPEVYVVQYDQKKGYFLKNISKNYSTLERFRKFYSATVKLDMSF